MTQACRRTAGHWGAQIRLLLLELGQGAARGELEERTEATPVYGGARGPVSRQEDKGGAQGMNPVHKENLRAPLDDKFNLRLCAYNNYSTCNLKMIEL